MRTKLLIVVLMIAAGMMMSCTKKSSTKANAKEEKPKAEAKAPPADADAILAAVKETYVCKQNNMYLGESEKSGALCQDGAKVLKWTERMIKDGWSKQEVLELVTSLTMGRALIEKTSRPACGQDGKLKADVFIMSYCPYGVKYVTDTLVPLVNEMQDAVDFTPHFIMQKGPDGKMQAMHGQKEADENLRMVCIREKYGNKKWLEYTKCFAAEIYGNPQAPKEWKYCAEKTGLDATAIDACFKSEAATMAEPDLALIQQYGAGASPTAIYNCDSKIVGAIPYMQVRGHLCKLIPGKKPAACQ